MHITENLHEENVLWNIVILIDLRYLVFHPHIFHSFVLHPLVLRSFVLCAFVSEPFCLAFFRRRIMMAHFRLVRFCRFTLLEGWRHKKARDFLIFQGAFLLNIGFFYIASIFYQRSPFWIVVLTVCHLYLSYNAFYEI